MWWCTGVVRACTDGAANILYDCQSVDMPLPTLISGDFDSLHCDVLNYYDNLVKVCHLAFTFSVSHVAAASYFQCFDTVGRASARAVSS